MRDFIELHVTFFSLVNGKKMRYSFISKHVSVRGLANALRDGRGATIVVGPNAQACGVITLSNWIRMRKYPCHVHTANGGRLPESEATLEDVLLPEHVHQLRWYTKARFYLNNLNKSSATMK